MNKPLSGMLPPKLGLTLAGVLAFTVSSHADTFGTGANTFTIDFVTIGNPGNGDDAGAGGGIYSSPYGGVAYPYRMGTTQVPLDWITKATAGGLSGVSAYAATEFQPADEIEWYMCAAFVNWLNTSTGHHPAYNLTLGGIWSMSLWSSEEAWQMGGENRFRHKDAFYFLPSEDEWYKAAYHKNDGVTANYWDYPTASNSAPTAVMNGTAAGTAVYSLPDEAQPAAVDSAGGLSAYGTMGQGGNGWEQLESEWDGVNNMPVSARAVRGGSAYGPVANLRSSTRTQLGPLEGFATFRVASVASVVPVPLVITGVRYNPGAHALTLTWRNSGATSYAAKYSFNMTNWGGSLAAGLNQALDEVLDDGEQITVTLALEGVVSQNESAVFFRIEEE